MWQVAVEKQVFDFHLEDYMNMTVRKSKNDEPEKEVFRWKCQCHEPRTWEQYSDRNNQEISGRAQ